MTCSTLDCDTRLAADNPNDFCGACAFRIPKECATCLSLHRNRCGVCTSCRDRQLAKIDDAWDRRLATLTRYDKVLRGLAKERASLV